VSLVLGCVVAVLVTHSITGPLRTMVHVAERVAVGDLTVPVRAVSRDELGRVLLTMHNMTTELAALVSKVRDCSDSLGSEAARLAATSKQLADSAQSEAGSLEETASSIEEITAAVKQNANHASQASKLMAATKDAAAGGATVMQAVLQNMELTYGASQKIVGISHVIGEIASQTNILALNAAVEAARAGERGQGFAVVASEVRNLAVRSAEAAKDVKNLVEDSLKQVDAGRRLVQDAALQMQGIAERVHNTANALEEITLACEEQSGGIAHISDAMSELDEIAQRNVVLVEETAAAAAAFSDRASMLDAAVGVFKLEAATCPPVASVEDTRRRKVRTA
jgi:methyl-accepting chemotaxis protein